MTIGLRKKRDPGPWVLILMSVLMWGILHMITGISALGPSAYNSYTLQALSWLNGRLDVDNRAYLELAIYEGRYYVSFPPLPSVLLLPFALVFSKATPDNFLVKAEALFALILIYKALKNIGIDRIAAVLHSFLFVFGSSLLPLTLEGAVWYHAQMLAFALTAASIYLITEDRPTPGIFCYALSVACRPFNALYGIVIAAVYMSVSVKAGMKVRQVMRNVRGGILAGLLTAAAIGVFNTVRFADPLEFGHSYLPEFSFQGGIQFSVRHIPGNAKTFLWGLPFQKGDSGLEMKRFGFSALIACPQLTLLLIWFIRDLVRKNLTAEKSVIAAVFMFHFFLLLCHRTFGGFQYGARYCVDLIPYALFYRLCEKKSRDRASLPDWILPGCGMILALIGAVMIHL